MKILTVNGSPKGEFSITLQSVEYLERKFPQHEFDYLHVGAKIRQYEKDFESAKKKIEQADLILFSYPVYTFIVPSQLHRFIELMKEHGVDVEGKYATQISTSKHFYDVTAHNFIRDNCWDLKMKYVKGLSADMDDILTEKGRKEVVEFLKYVTWCREKDIFEALPEEKTPFTPKMASEAEECSEKIGDVVIVADLAKEDQVLQSMIDRFMRVSDKKVRLVNIHDFPFKGGCISCFHCASGGKCIYKDGFDTFLRENIQKTQAIVAAFTIKDHSMGSLFKTYDDRQFCNGHRTVTMGMPFGYLINGPYSREENLKMIVEGRAEVGGNFLAGIATNEMDPDGEIDKLAEKLSYAINHRYVQPSNFLGVGGMKIFRDLIWLMQGLMRADHKFYKAHGQYDFPQKHRGRMMAMYLVGSLMKNEKIMKKAQGKMREGMIGPYRKAIRKD